MGRRAQGWQIKWVGGIAHVRFRFEGRRREITTGTRDPNEAPVLAARIYADVISGRMKRARSGALIHPTTALDELAADWLAAIESELGDGTPGTYEVYARHWTRFFRTIGELTAPGATARYRRHRLSKVQATTVRKELSALRSFAAWLFEEGLIAELPAIEGVPKKVLGHKRDSGIRGASEELSAHEVEAILAKLPKVSRGVHVQAFCTFLYETALRPRSTAARLRTEDLTPFGLHIRPEADKNRWERTVPLSARARAALASVPMRPGQLIFAKRDIRDSLRKAAKAVLGDERGGRVTPYAFKHARITSWFEGTTTPDGRPATIPGVQFLTGITRVETLQRYLRASRRAAESIVGYGGNSGAGGSMAKCEGEDLNLHGSYPTSTSSSVQGQNPVNSAPDAIEESVTCGPETTLSGALHPKLPGLVRLAIWRRGRAA